MALRDIFLPKIAHSNPEVRKKAVQKEKDTGMLQRVIANDQDSTVVEAAKARLQEITGKSK